MGASKHPKGEHYLKPDQIKEIVKLYESGLPIREIAKRYNRSYGGIWSVLSRSGVEFRPRTWIKKKDS